MRDPKEQPAEQHPQNKKYVTNISDTLRKIDSSPSSSNCGNGEESRAGQIPVDLVEEESMESFPASDPPSHTRPDKNRPEPRRPGQE